MKKFLSIILGVLLLCSCFIWAACNNGGTPGGSTGGGNGGETGGGGEEPPSQTVVSRLATREDGTVYLEVDGKPFMYTGAQIRIDTFLNVENWVMDELDVLFKSAAELNVNCVEIPLWWSLLEPVKDEYDFLPVGQLLSMAHKYGLRVEILIFTVNICGSSTDIPDYIANDPVTYPRYIATGIVGETYFLVQNDPNLLNREKLLVENLMNAIADWDEAMGNPHTVISAQIHNESDVFPIWRLHQYQIKLPDGSRRLTRREAWDETLDAMDQIGQVVKNSRYSVVTRHNTAEACNNAGGKLEDYDINGNYISSTAYTIDWTVSWREIVELDGIDMVGDDSYNENVSVIKSEITNMRAGALSGNLPHISENGGWYSSVGSQILTAVALNGGYLIYELVGSKEMKEEWGLDRPDQGIFEVVGAPVNSLTDKAHTPLARSILKGLKFAGYEVTLTQSKDIAAFNIRTNIPSNSITQDINTSKLSFRFSTTSGAIGFAAVRGDYVTLYVTSNSSVTLGNGTFGSVETGSYTADGTWQKNGTANLSSNRLDMTGGIVYRVKVNSFGSTLTSNTYNNIA